MTNDEAGRALDALLTAGRIDILRRRGVVFFDVDDTLLARRRKGEPADQTYAESEAAPLVPALLRAGVRVCLITGHGWRQLETRFVRPLVELWPADAPDGRAALRDFRVYANRGATKIVFEADGSYRESEPYAASHALDEADRPALSALLDGLKEDFARDLAGRLDWYREAYPDFPFGELPVRVIERERVIVGLRPLPSSHYAGPETRESARARLFRRGRAELARRGLAEKYQFDKCGRSTLEITRRDVSKEIAFADLLAETSAERGISRAAVESASIYLGDEFAEGGNDYAVPRAFPGCLCLSVGADAPAATLAGRVVPLGPGPANNGVARAAEAIRRMIKFLT